MVIYMNKKFIYKIMDMMKIGVKTGFIMFILCELTQFLWFSPNGNDLFTIVFAVIAMIISSICFYEDSKKYFPLSDRAILINLALFILFFFIGIFLSKLFIYMLVFIYKKIL